MTARNDCLTEDAMHASILRLAPLLSCLAALVLSSPAHAEALVICHDGGPGSTKQAAKAVETFLRHTEVTAGLKTNSLTGEYHTTARGCDAYIRDNAPSLVVLDLATHLRKAASLKLAPIGHLGAPDSVSWHVVVRDETHADLKSLSGKTVLTTTPDDTTFITAIALAGKGNDLTFKRSRRALKALRNVGRGKAEAAMVDQDAVAHMGELDLPHTLKSIYSSEGLPALTMSATTSNSTVTKVAGALSKLCDGPGQKLCKTFKVKRFQAADKARLKALQGRYRP
ncbi:MAG: PhnD/SsuA/transferrin family substrate-binding protein [Myxococcota bacterium]